MALLHKEFQTLRREYRDDRMVITVIDINIISMANELIFGSRMASDNTIMIY